MPKTSFVVAICATAARAYTEKLATYRLPIEGSRVQLAPRPNPPVEPVALPNRCRRREDNSPSAITIEITGKISPDGRMESETGKGAGCAASPERTSL